MPALIPFLALTLTLCGIWWYARHRRAVTPMVRTRASAAAVCLAVWVSVGIVSIWAGAPRT